MAKPRGKRAVARGISRTMLKTDPCKIDLSKIRRLPEKGLMNVWARVRKHGPRGSNHALHALASYASNLAAAKASTRMYTGKHRKDAVAVYMHAAKLAENRLKQSCAARVVKALSGGRRRR